MSNPVEAMKVINTDPWLFQTIQLRSGRLVTGLEIQRAIWSSAGKFLMKLPSWDQVPPCIFEAYALWGKAINALTRSCPEEWNAVSFWIDCKVKYHFLEEYKKKYSDFSKEKFMGVSMGYHRVNPFDGLATQMVLEDTLSMPISQTDLKMAAKEPSSHKRAKQRMEILSRNGALAKSVEWTGYRVEGMVIPMTIM